MSLGERQFMLGLEDASPTAAPARSTRSAIAPALPMAPAEGGCSKLPIGRRCGCNTSLLTFRMQKLRLDNTPGLPSSSNKRPSRLLAVELKAALDGGLGLPGQPTPPPAR